MFMLFLFIKTYSVINVPIAQKALRAGGALARSGKLSQATVLGVRMCFGTFFSKKGFRMMYQVIKVLNNNAFLARHGETETIFLGKGIGFGKKAGDNFQEIKDAREYTLTTKEKTGAGANAVKGIDPIFLEAAARIIDEAEVVFDSINHDILLPLADHIAFAARRAAERIEIPNPFIADIKALFGKEYAVVLKCRDIIEEMTGYHITDAEAGFVALHIHSGLSDEHVTEILKVTRTIDECFLIVEDLLGQSISRDSLAGIRLMSHLYYMIARVKAGEDIHIDLNEFIRTGYPKAGRLAEKICTYISKELGTLVDRKELGYLAVLIQTIVNP